jgi:hypothetical protein
MSPKPLFVYASEVAACIGRNPYKPPREAAAAIVKRYDPELYASRGIVSEADVAERVLRETPRLREHLSRAASEARSTDGIQDKVAQASKLLPEGLDKDAKKILESTIRSTMYTSVGTHRESEVFEGLEERLGQAVTLDPKTYKIDMGVLGDSGIPWVLCGKIDGRAADGGVVEIKNRMRRLFGKVPDYESVQVLCYMKMLESECAYLVESFQDRHAVHTIPWDAAQWEEIEDTLKQSLENIFCMEG